jgi:hypothetical protein
MPGASSVHCTATERVGRTAMAPVRSRHSLQRKLLEPLPLLSTRDRAVLVPRLGLARYQCQHTLLWSPERAPIAACLASLVQLELLENLAGQAETALPDTLAHQAVLLDHALPILLHPASRARLDLPDLLDHQEKLVTRDPMASQEMQQDPASLASQGPRDLQDLPESLAQMDLQENPVFPQLAEELSQEALDSLDLQDLRDLQDHQETQEALLEVAPRDPKVTPDLQGHLVPMALPETQDQQETLALEATRESALSTALWTEASFSKMEPTEWPKNAQLLLPGYLFPYRYLTELRR